MSTADHCVATAHGQEIKIEKPRIDFEDCANFITSRRSGVVLVRCNFELTDCGEAEPLDDFVARHGGPEATTAYLKQCYRDRSPIVDKAGITLKEGQLIRAVVCVGPHGKTQQLKGEIAQLYVTPPGATLKLTKATWQTVRDHREARYPGDRLYVSLPGEWREGVFVCDKLVDDFSHGHHAWVEVQPAAEKAIPN